MYDIHAFNDRQTGNSFWREYDTAIKRLTCLKIDEYQGIAPNLEIQNFNPEPPILACEFSQSPGNEHIVCLANEDGKIAIQNTNSNQESNTQLEGSVAHYNAIFDISWMMGKMKLVTASGDHTVRLWDVSESTITQEMQYHGHFRSVKTVASRCYDSSVFASGARDGLIFVWDTRAKLGIDLVPKPDSVINVSRGPSTPSSGSKGKKKFIQSKSHINSITGLVFQDDMTLISCTAGDGLIKVWDMRKSYTIHKRDPVPKYTLPYAGSTLRNGFTHLLIDNNAMKLYASCLDDIIYCYNISTYNEKPVMKYTGHQIKNSFFIKSSLSPDGLYLISGSGDEKAYVWNVKHETPLIRLNGHNAEVTCVAWCQKGDVKIVTCSDDSKHKIWKIGQEFYTDEEVLDIKGRAESVPLDVAESRLRLHRTPLSGKRIVVINDTITPVECSMAKLRRKLCERCLNMTPGNLKAVCINCDFTSSIEKKRKQNNDSNSPETTSSKRARKLFDSENTLSSADRILATILEDNQETFSPTLNLPNFVVDGTAPHLRIISPQKGRENKNWLHNYQVRKELIQRMNEVGECSTSKKLKLDEEVLSPSQLKRTPKRRPSSEKKKSSVKCQSPLLKFFKVTATSKNCDQQCVLSRSNMSPQPERKVT